MSFELVWQKIVKNQGEQFQTITGLDFTYSLEGNYVIPSRTDYKIPKSDVKKAFDLLPLKEPGEINDVVRGPAYVWSLIHDKRIIQ